MDTEIKTSMEATEAKAQYDASAKRLLGQKSILAHILTRTIEEFKGMDPRQVEACIEGEPHIAAVSVEPGLTNKFLLKDGQRIAGLNTENIEVDEGKVVFDIVFYVRMRDGISQIIVNVEAQKDEPTEYDIIDRALYYVSRLISSQKEREFTNSNYNDIKRVYSIWVCMNMPENCMNYLRIVNQQILGSYQWKGRAELFNVVLIGLSDAIPEYKEEYELHRLLGALLSNELSASEKLRIVETEYGIPVGDTIRKEVNAMCNLSLGIEEKGIKKGIEQGISRVIINMQIEGFTLNQIAAATGKSIDTVKAVLEEHAERQSLV